MSENSNIEWTHHTFNPWWGCAKVSPACDNCYAERDANRFTPDKQLWGVNAERREFGDKHWNEPLKWNLKAAEAGERHRVFCASMADVFDKNAPEGARERLWSLIEATPNLDWLILTKRIGNVSRMIPENWKASLPSNVWLGISIVNQEEADRDIPKLLEVNTEGVRFLSMEPLLGPVDLENVRWKENTISLRMNVLSGDCWVESTSSAGAHTNKDDGNPSIGWIISGGESGNSARPMHPDWIKTLRDQCAVAQVPFLFKQWGEWLPVPRKSEAAKNPRSGYIHPTMNYGELPSYPNGNGYGDEQLEQMGCVYVAKVGKKSAGRLFDGVTHDEFPKT